ncbi:hypothetical protein TanjilG_08741 [Lupinus angustifolius]|uniref:Uncharacterized protein n=1 Tax=Lupinus angustifolius TaxID=3871 RepID=A0A4P1QQ46_LUPAN|nr:hypothetical protein TanjilG_08741 [Lupinus angustifolius]
MAPKEKVIDSSNGGNTPGEEAKMQKKGPSFLGQGLEIAPMLTSNMATLADVVVSKKLAGLNGSRGFMGHVSSSLPSSPMVSLIHTSIRLNSEGFLVQDAIYQHGESSFYEDERVTSHLPISNGTCCNNMQEVVTHVLRSIKETMRDNGRSPNDGDISMDCH